MMSSTSKNLTKIPIVTGYDDPSPCHSSNDRCTSCGDVDTFGGTMSCPSCSQPFCPKCFLPTQHEPCCRSACLAPILLSTVVLLRRWQQFMRYAVLHNYSYVHLCSTHDQFADGLTKVTVTQQWLEMHNIMLNL